MKRIISALLIVILVLSLLTDSVSANEPAPPDEPQYISYDVSGSDTLYLGVSGAGTAAFNVTVTGNVRDYGNALSFSLTSFHYSVSNVPSGYSASATYKGYTVNGGTVYARIQCKLCDPDTTVSHIFSVRLDIAP